MNALDQHAMFKEMDVTTFYIGKSLDDPKRAIAIFQASKNALYYIFINPEQNQLFKLLVMFMKIKNNSLASLIKKS